MQSLRNSVLPRLAHTSRNRIPVSTSATYKNFFHATSFNMVKAGDKIPSLELQEGSPGDKVNLADELSGKGIIIGVPAAFSPACSDTHIPGYVAHGKLGSAGKVFVTSVNDAFVMKAWGKQLDPDNKMRFIADSDGSFAKSLDLLFDATPLLGNHRSKRYALVVENGVVKEAHVEEDPTKVSVSSAESVLGKD